MKLYVGIDLHSNNSYVNVITEGDKVVFAKKLSNDSETILHALRPYKTDIAGVVLESTYNWYWLADALIEDGYKVHLANTTAIQQYNGMKHTNDKSDARWLAVMLKLGILPEGYIYPKETRGIRELLRKRCILVKQKTMNILSLQMLITRYRGIKLSGGQLQKLTEEKLNFYLPDKNVMFSAKCQLELLHFLFKQVDAIEKHLLKQLRKNETFKLLETIPGIGQILSSTIYLETGEISRFNKVGDYVSYCRTVSSKRLSNGKNKGANNRKNGNAYLSWAFTEAAHYAIRYYPVINKYYQRKLNKTCQVIAIKTIAHKLARAAYYVMKDGVKYEMNKAFG